MAMDQEQITVGVVHRQKLFLEGLIKLIASSDALRVIVGGTDKHNASQMMREFQPDILLLDANVVEREDLAEAKNYLDDHSHTNIILLSDQNYEIEYLMTALACGIRGFLLKDLSSDILTQAIKTVHKGEFWLHPQASQCLIKVFQHLKLEYEKCLSPSVKREERPVHLLTAREWEVLERIALGDSNQEIADCLGISEPTVKAHVSHVIKKLHVNDRMNAALLAIRNGWVGIESDEKNVKENA